MPQSTLQNGAALPSPGGNWSVGIRDGTLSTGEEGMTLQLRWTGTPARSYQTPDLQFELPLYGFSGNNPHNTITWPKGEERCAIHVEGMWDKVDLTLVPSTRRITCETQMPRVVIEPYYEGMLILGVAFIGLLIGAVLRIWRERAELKIRW